MAPVREQDDQYSSLRAVDNTQSQHAELVLGEAHNKIWQHTYVRAVRALTPTGIEPVIPVHVPMFIVLQPTTSRKTAVFNAGYNDNLKRVGQSKALRPTQNQEESLEITDTHANRCD